jgi:hypothetical protein
VIAEQPVHGGAAHDQARACRRVLRQRHEQLQEDAPGVVEASSAGERARERPEQRRLQLRAIRALHEPARDRQPMDGGLRRTAGDLSRGLGQQRDRGRVTRSGGLLDVMGHSGRACPGALEPGGGARVPGEAAAGADRLVDGAAHDRMAEAEAPRLVGDLQQVRGHELVERHQRRRAVEPGDLGREVDLERVAEDRRAVEQCAGVGGPRTAPGTSAYPGSRSRASPGRGVASARASCIR